ncbi:prefoldin subunit 2-like [Paramacrobiotus metropolitanus]|uniref:prefoldin subunit 2-like n=1 Tax=Paramacrobiotus metropolitanus TaxID=2943436 RepID=UPI0024458C8A|nr:prefoldin subunit 2-like [Paramacrobiotus metropolitanus]
MADGDTKDNSGGKMQTEQIVNGFNRLRQDQNALSEKITELEADVNEHTLVEQMLEKLEPERKCFRRVGGVLVERTVAEVLPAISSTRSQIVTTLKAMREQLEIKSKEIQEYKKVHKIVVRGVDAPDMPLDELVAS